MVRASLEAFVVRASPEVKQLLAAKVQRWGLEQAPLAGLVCGWNERMIWLIWFAPYQIDKIWPEVMTGGSCVVELGQGSEQTVAMAVPLSETL